MVAEHHSGLCTRRSPSARLADVITHATTFPTEHKQTLHTPTLDEVLIYAIPQISVNDALQISINTFVVVVVVTVTAPNNLQIGSKPQPL